MNVGRPIQFQPDAVLEKAMQLFWRKGYQGSSLQALLAATGLSKSSLYNAFGGKKQLFQRCLIRYRDQSAGRLRRHLEEAESAHAFISETLLSVAREPRTGTGPRGCFVMNTATEFAQCDGDVARQVDHSLTLFHDRFLAAVKRGQQEGEITRNIDPGMLATYLVTCMGGLRTMVKGGASVDQAERTVRIILRALQ